MSRNFALSVRTKRLEQLKKAVFCLEKTVLIEFPNFYTCCLDIVR